MSRPPEVVAEDKQRIVLSVRVGEMTIAEAAPRNKVSEQSVSRWKSQFLDAGRASLAEGARSGPSSREQQLAAEVDELTTALGEAHVQVRAWKRSAEHRLGPTRTSR